MKRCKLFILSVVCLSVLNLCFCACDKVYDPLKQNQSGLNSRTDFFDESINESGDRSNEKINGDNDDTDISDEKENDMEQVKKSDPIVEFVFEDYGMVRLQLYPDVAPISVENFLTYVKQGFYDGTIMHRVIDGFMIQGGGYYLDGNYIKEKDTLQPIKGEFASNGVQNDIKHTLGVISMARTQVKDSATSQFFICSATAAHLDGDYAAFGKTTDKGSDDVVLAIAKAQTVYVNQSFANVPYPPVVLTSVRIISE